jgi:dolichyl-phosphate beta-glucosyltransferase
VVPARIRLPLCVAAVAVGLVYPDQAGRAIPFVGFCDADMATDLSALDAAVSMLAAGHHVVIGSRTLSTSVVQVRSSAARRVGAAMFRAMSRAIVPVATDIQCGFKFFSGPLARAAALPLRTAGFAFDVELIATCLRLGATVTEIPVRWQDMAGSTFSVRRHSTAVFRDLAAIWLRSRTARGMHAVRLRDPPPRRDPHRELLPAGATTA